MNWIAIFILIGSIFNSVTVHSKTVSEKSSLYENCTTFNDSSLYGGEICGTDVMTYANSEYLNCINYKHSSYIGIMHMGPCEKGDEHCALDPIYDPVCGSDNVTYSNYQALLCNNFRESAKVNVVSKGECTTVDYCIRNGLTIDGVNPVCASNGLTYLNAAQVKCLRKYNASMQIVHDNGCTVSHVYSIYGVGKTVCSIAHQIYEWNPVCGADLVTYPNPFIFLCYKPDLEVIFNGECDTPTMEACVAAHKNDIYTNGTLSNNDFTTDDQVCGNDGRTYDSIHHLNCKSHYNKYLSYVHDGPCTGVNDNPCGAANEEGMENIICGSDGVSYISPEALWCVRNKENSNLYEIPSSLEMSHCTFKYVTHMGGPEFNIQYKDTWDLLSITHLPSISAARIRDAAVVKDQHNVVFRPTRTRLKFTAGLDVKGSLVNSCCLCIF